MSILKRIRSVQYAINGIGILVRTQPNARIHLIAMVLVVSAGYWFKITHLEWISVVLCIALVFSLEAVNTALECLTDLVSPQYNPMAGKAKDVAAAAVLIAALGSVVVGLIIFIPKISALM